MDVQSTQNEAVAVSNVMYCKQHLHLLFTFYFIICVRRIKWATVAQPNLQKLSNLFVLCAVPYVHMCVVTLTRHRQ